MIDGFYRAFEDRHRGSRELIKKRLQAYLPFIQPLSEQYPTAPALDLGCGRGEWLEVLASAGFTATGVDLDDGMLSVCHNLGLPASKGEAVAHLATLSDNSQAVVSAFHVVEHISFEQLKLLVSESLRVLKPGGLLIMETPNTENIIVATRNFYLDPTHQRPIPQELLSFVPEYYGFKRVKAIRLQESQDLAQYETLSLQDVFQGVSPDYAVIAQKEADPALMAFTAIAFEREYGLTLETLSARYDNATLLKIQQIETKAQQAEAAAQSADNRAQQNLAEARAVAGEAKVELDLAKESVAGAERRITELLKSTSWKITRPIRSLGYIIQWVRARCNTPFSLTSISKHRLRVGFVSIVNLTGAYAQKSPRLKRIALRLIRAFPGLEFRFRQFFFKSRLDHQLLQKTWTGTNNPLAAAKEQYPDVNHEPQPLPPPAPNGINAHQRSPLEANFSTYQGCK